MNGRFGKHYSFVVGQFRSYIRLSKKGNEMSTAFEKAIDFLSGAKSNTSSLLTQISTHRHECLTIYKKTR